MRVVVIARHPSGSTLYRSDSAMDVASSADKRYLVRCVHEKTVLLRIGNLPYTAGDDACANATC